MPEGDCFAWRRLISDCLFCAFLRGPRRLACRGIALLALIMLRFLVFLACKVFCFLDCCGRIFWEMTTGFTVFFMDLTLYFLGDLPCILAKLTAAKRLLFLFLFPVLLFLTCFVPMGLLNCAKIKWGVLDNVVIGLAMAKCSRLGSL